MSGRSSSLCKNSALRGDGSAPLAKSPITTTITVKSCKLQHAASNLQQTYHTCSKSCKEMGGAMCVMPVIRDAFSQQAVAITQWADTINWTVRCDWLQVASSRLIVHMHSIYGNEGCKCCGTCCKFCSSCDGDITGARLIRTVCVVYCITVAL